MGDFLVLIHTADEQLYYGIEDSIGDTVQPRVFVNRADVRIDDWDFEGQSPIICRCETPLTRAVEIFTTYAGGSYWTGRLCQCEHLVSGISRYDEDSIEIHDGIPAWSPWQTEEEVFAHQNIT